MRRKRQSNSILIAWTVIFAMISIVSLSTSIIMYLYFTGERNAMPVSSSAVVSEDEDGVFYSQEELDALLAEKEAAAEDKGMQEAKDDLLSCLQSMMEGDGSTVNMLRSFYPEHTIVYSDAKYHFIPINRSLKPNTYQLDYFEQNEDGTLHYEDGSGLVTYKGIDVSKFQGKINWQKVKEDGVDFALIRLGIRGYTEGKIVLDETFQENLQSALEQEIHCGIYFFSQAVSEEEMEEELDFIRSNIEGYEFDGPIVIDVEDVANGKGRTGQMSAEERTNYIIQFCEGVKEIGHTPMIYGNLKSMMLMMELERLEEYKKWYAYYNMPVYYPYDFDIWQYKESGEVNGISTAVDLNIMFRPWWES